MPRERQSSASPLSGIGRLHLIARWRLGSRVLLGLTAVAGVAGSASL